MYRTRLKFKTQGKGLVEITEELNRVIHECALKEGMCHILLQHTSASLTLMENADPTAQRDLENFMDKLVPDGLDYFQHVSEGEDDMPSHIKSVLTRSQITLPVTHGSLELGTWQGVFLWEHRKQKQLRKMIVSIY